MCYIVSFTLLSNAVASGAKSDYLLEDIKQGYIEVRSDILIWPNQHTIYFQNGYRDTLKSVESSGHSFCQLKLTESETEVRVIPKGSVFTITKITAVEDYSASNSHQGDGPEVVTHLSVNSPAIKTISCTVINAVNPLTIATFTQHHGDYYHIQYLTYDSEQFFSTDSKSQLELDGPALVTPQEIEQPLYVEAYQQAKQVDTAITIIKWVIPLLF